MLTTPDTATENHCPNCGAVANARYCPECGQQQRSKRHTLRSLAAGALRRTFNLDDGLTHTALQLSVRPETVILGYVSGQTVRYTSPGAYLLIAFALFALSASLFGGFRGGGAAERVAALLLVPCVAAASRLFFARGRFNYAEHLILVMYTLAHVTLGLAVVQIAFPVLNRQSASILTIGALAAGVAYIAWVYAKAFRTRAILAALGGLAALVGGAGLWFVIVLNIVPLLRR